MRRLRIIPVLLLRGEALVKTTKFKNPTYIGDPINAVKIFNEREVDELMILDIEASRENREPSYDLIRQMAEECFMPLSHGGGIHHLDHIRKLFDCGIETVALGHAALKKPELLEEASSIYGAQSMVGIINAKKNFWGNYDCFTQGLREKYALHPRDLAQAFEKSGVGEILIQSIDRDGTMSGYDLQLIGEITKAVSVPVIACGGAGSFQDFETAASRADATSVAAGSLFVFQRATRSVLISYPDSSEIDRLSERLFKF